MTEKKNGEAQADELPYVEMLAVRDCYIRQYGQGSPEYVRATKKSPVRVKIPKVHRKRNQDGSIVEIPVLVKERAHLVFAQPVVQPSHVDTSPKPPDLHQVEKPPIDHVAEEGKGKGKKTRAADR